MIPVDERGENRVVGDFDVGATSESLLVAAAVAGGPVLADAPVVSGHVRPLQDALEGFKFI